MARPYCILLVSYCNFILEIDKEENLKHWKTNAFHLYDNRTEKEESGGGKEKIEIKGLLGVRCECEMWAENLLARCLQLQIFT
jgi:hypothetical protein